MNQLLVCGEFQFMQQWVFVCLAPAKLAVALFERLRDEEDSCWKLRRSDVQPVIGGTLPALVLGRAEGHQSVEIFATIV